MSFSVTFRPEVASDLASAANWYDQQESGLGDEFLEEYRRALIRLAELPLARAADHSGLRYLKLDRFPYRTCYRVREKEIVVAAVFHMRRNPNRLLDRR